MAPVLEHLAGPPQPPVQGRAVVGTEPGEKGHVMGAAEDIDRVELDEADSIDDAPEMTHVDPACGPRVVKALGAQRDTAGLFDGELPHRRAT